MKKIVIAVLIVIIGLFANACNSNYRGDTINNAPDDGNTVPDNPVITQENIVILADQSEGSEGTMTFYRQTEFGEEMFMSFPITIYNGAVLGFTEEPGNYRVSIDGLGFTGSGEFRLIKGLSGTIIVELVEWPDSTQMTFVILADQSVGREGTLTIYRRWENSDEMIQNMPILITNGGQFGFLLEPGDNYWIAITGLAFTSYAEFVVTNGQPNTIIVEMYEWPLITWYASLGNSPDTPPTIGLNQEVMRSSLSHNQDSPQQVATMSFDVMYTLNLLVDTCYLYDEQQNLLGTAAVMNYKVEFFTEWGNLAETWVVPLTTKTYILKCDVWSSGPNNDVIQASLTGMSSYPLTTAQQVRTLPLYGNPHHY